LTNISQNLDTAEAAVFISVNELKKRNVQIGDRRTSVTLEPQVWRILHDVAEKQNCSIHDLCTFINDRKNADSSLSSAIRVFLMSYLHIQYRKN